MPSWRQGRRAGDVARTAADTSRARRELGWRPRVDLVRGLAGQFAWVRARRERARAGSEREDEARRPARIGRDDREGPPSARWKTPALSPNSRASVSGGVASGSTPLAWSVTKPTSPKARPASPASTVSGPPVWLTRRDPRRGELGDLADAVEPRPVHVAVGAAVAGLEPGGLRTAQQTGPHALAEGPLEDPVAAARDVRAT